MQSFNLNIEHAHRSAELASRWEALIRGLDGNAAAEESRSLLTDIEATLEESTDSGGLRNWQVALALLRVWRADQDVRAAARAGESDLVACRGRLQVLLQEADEAVGELPSEQLRASLRTGYDLNAAQVNRKALQSALARLTLPTLYSAREKDRWSRRKNGGEAPPLPRVPVLRLVAFLDGAPWCLPNP